MNAGKMISDRFIEICRAVTADGHVNADELYYLATWLNENPKAMKCWPGILFVEPLNRFFADGQIDAAEIEAATRLLQQVETEYAESKAKGKLRADDRTKAIPSGEDQHVQTSTQGAQVLSLPVVNWKGKALASSIRGFYDVELATPRCTCPDFCCRCASFPTSHPARACKHIVKCFWEVYQNGQIVLSPQVAALLECAYFIQSGVSLNSHFLSLMLDSKAVIVSEGKSEWVNVVAFDGESYQRFGYNMEERRWSYGVQPANWEKVAATLNALFPKSPFRGKSGNSKAIT